MTRGRAIARLRRDRVALAALLVLALVVLASILAPLIPLPDPDTIDPSRRLLVPFEGGTFLGSDALGRDLTSRLLHGTRLSLAVAAIGTSVAASIGAGIGLTAGLRGGRVDLLLMRAIDVVMAFPYLLLAIALVAAFGPSLRNATLAIAIVNVPFFARTVRGQVLRLQEAEFVLAARALGYSELRVALRHVLPNVLPLLVVASTSTLGWMILETAGLSFLGLGAQPPTADLGGMLGQSRHLLSVAPTVALLPGAVIFLLAIALNLLGDALRDALSE